MLAAIFLPGWATAASPDKYAEASALSHGTWVKIDISTPGLQTLSRRTLNNFGFSNPDNVYVYGYGGRMISEALTQSQPDDLPPVPFQRGGDGSISFYAVGNIATIPLASTRTGMTFSHTINPYGDTSYYFLSDVKPEKETPVLDLSSTQGVTPRTSATRQLVHEVDLIQGATSGRNYLGEDFRSQKSQEFNFDLPDNADGNARINVRFAANTSGAPSSIMVSANGQRLPATQSDRIGAVTSSDQYYQVAQTVKSAEGVGNTLKVGIEYSQSGVVTMARLDWIEVEYTQSLAMRDGQLLFHVNGGINEAYSISGATESTVVWDVTDPGNVSLVKGSFDPAAKTLTLELKDKGFREFFAFEPSAKGASPAGRIKVASQNIHGMATPDMVIISPEEYTSAAERIADLHRRLDGMTVHVLTPEKIYNEFSSGNVDLSAFRKLLKMWHDRSLADSASNFRYCLLLGRPTYDQKMKNPETIKAAYPRVPIWQSATGLSESVSYCTDDFIGMLDDETRERNMWDRTINVGVGRYPVTSAAEAETVADKLEAYMTNPGYGVWRNNVMAIADDGDSAAHLKQTESGLKIMQSEEPGANYAYDRVYLDAFERKMTGTGLQFPDAKEKMLRKWEKEGTAFISYVGHANPKEWGHEKLLTWEDITGMSNQRLPVLYASTCSFGKWDAESVSGAEVMLHNSAGGVIALITPSRTVYINRNEYITDAMSAEFFRRDDDGLGQRLGDIVRLGKNNCRQKDDNMNRYHMMGDPALRMPVPRYTVTLDSIADRPVAAEQADSPVLQARSSVRITGRITDAEGNKVTFNGPVQYTLFDAEKSVKTYGWGENGVEWVFNDRSSKLATGSASVRDGEWSATILMPTEIANNYTPALITLYAYDTTTLEEANGSSERIYVYGYDTDALEDSEGPEIENFCINSMSFADGDVVHADPIALATFSDNSGINISDAGIGHKMSLTLDGDKIYDDLGNFFEPDAEDDGKGSIAYPLPHLEPGDHTLKLTVWDNANNSSSASVNFKVGINLKPELTELNTVYDRDTDMLNVSLTTDRALSRLDFRLECFALDGLLLWSMERNAYCGKDSALSYSWDLTDSEGRRLPRGIYVLRSTVGTDEGITQTESKKIAIPAK